MSAMLPALTVYRGGARTEVFSHAGEEFVYVVEGTLLLWLGGQDHVLLAGESRYFKAEIERQFVNPDSDHRTLTLGVQSE